jgi:hypothetical protein
MGFLISGIGKNEQVYVGDQQISMQVKALAGSDAVCLV